VRRKRPRRLRDLNLVPAEGFEPPTPRLRSAKSKCFNDAPRFIPIYCNARQDGPLKNLAFSQVAYSIALRQTPTN